jgi:hypothetical protein
MPKKSDKKSPYDSLPMEWKESVSSMSLAQIDDEIVKTAKLQEDNVKAMKDDPDLENLKYQVKEVAAPYREATKANKLKISYAIEMIEAKGGK